MREGYRGFPSWQQALREYALGRHEVDGWTLRQIGKCLWLSRERIRQILAEAYQARDGAAPTDLWKRC